jgi:hypothetical protein
LPLADQRGAHERTVPILSGLALRAALGLLRPKIRMPFGIAAAIVVGAIATVISGEYKIGWEFLLIDIPLVGLAATVALAGTRTLRRIRARDRSI